ncbi:MAG: hypothetical protein J0I98_03905 [Mesorhizobium sp.]|nr:hypothetical protein [Mesorhizobium sp.]MBN9241917.1 hypothetical protein [Mesorhizobium sp.]
MLDRDKVINWWTGRISDPELAEWTGMAPRAVAIVLNLPHMRAGVSGGGRGSRHTRRVDPKTRNAVAIVHALSEAGLTLELATNIIGATPVIAGTPTEVVDYRAPLAGVRSMMMVDPKGNWLPTDIVPWHVWERFVFPCYSIDNPKPRHGDILEVPFDQFTPNETGVMFVDRSGSDLPNLEIKSLTEAPVYSGEIDPLGLYTYENYQAETLPRFDEHILIVNGRWVFIKSPDPSPMHAMQNFMAGEFNKGKSIEYDFDPVSVIEPDKKTVRVIGWGRDEEEQERARYHLNNFDSLLDVNITLAVRKMKRRAYGLPVGKPSSPLPWMERVKIAQRYPAPQPVVIDVAAEVRRIEEEDFFRKWSTDDDGNRVLVGLSKAETDEYQALEARSWESHRDNSFPWSSVAEMNREKSRSVALWRKHEAARLTRVAQEADERMKKMIGEGE